MLFRPEHYTHSKVPFRRGKVTCPVCGETHHYHCSVTQDEGLALCRKVPSDKQASDGRYVHILRFSSDWRPPAKALKPVKAVAPERAGAERLNDVYSALLSELELTAAHGDELLVGRGLSDTTIAYSLYASVPDSAKGDEIAECLSRRFDLKGVPGFYLRDGRWRLNTKHQGFYIPYRDECGRITGLQIRRDGNPDPKYLWLTSTGLPEGTAATACLHFCKPSIASRSGEAHVTEGALKAERVGEFKEVAAVALAGVSAMRPEMFIKRLLGALPKLRRVVVCFDMDWMEKPEVRRALLRLLRKLKETNLEVSGKTWDIALGKGYDDYLFNSIGRAA